MARKAQKVAGKRGVSEIDRQIGLRMRTMRLTAGLSQEQMGHALGVTFQQIQKYEKGSNRTAISRLMEIAAVLKTSVNELIGINGAGPITETKFDYQTYRLAASLTRLANISPQVAARFRELIERVCDDLETEKKKKR